MKQVIAMHGWSGDSNSWKLWALHFENHGWEWQSAERGYGERPIINPKWKQQHDNLPNKRVAICHSLGPHLLPNETLHNSTDIVLINSFSSFIPNGPESRPLKIALRGMQEKIGTSQEKEMLNYFLAKASHPADISKLPLGPIHLGLSIDGRKKLQDDLHLLINTSGLPDGFQQKARVLVIEGKEDAILSLSTRASLINDLKKYLKSPPEIWSLKNVGHSIIDENLIIKVRTWLEK